MKNGKAGSFPFRLVMICEMGTPVKKSLCDARQWN